MKGDFYMGMFQDLNRATLAKEIPALYAKTTELVLSCTWKENKIVVSSVLPIQDWDISASFFNQAKEFVIESMLSLKCQPLYELVAHVWATKVNTEEKVDLGYRKVVACLGNSGQNDGSIYFFVKE